MAGTKFLAQISSLAVILAISVLIVAPIISLAQPGGNNNTFITGGGVAEPICPAGKLCNPLGPTGTLKDFLKKVVDTLIKFGIPIAALFIIWAGFKFVTARGDETAIKEAKQIFWYTIIGTFILLASKLLVEILETTVREVAGR